MRKWFGFSSLLECPDIGTTQTQGQLHQYGIGAECPVAVAPRTSRHLDRYGTSKSLYGGGAQWLFRRPSASRAERPFRESLVEYGWQPDRVCVAQTNLSGASIYWHTRETQRGAVSSNSRSQTVLFQQC